ncbi:MAG: hypothetical protein JXR95_01990 [Deltaproteobacteria bacterium]|nr:hypothetical protein [Deltaproteobacteria bacterium]
MNGFMKFATLVIFASIFTGGISSSAAKKINNPKKPVYCTVYSIAANEKAGKFPAELKNFRHIFNRMPFKVFRSFKLKQKNSVAVYNKYSITSISKKYKVAVKLLERILGKSDKVKYRIQFQVRKASGVKKKTVTIHDMVMKLNSAKPMFIAGPKDGNDTLLIGLVCR